VYSAASLAVDAYDAYNMNIRYGGVVSQDVKDQTNFKLGYDLALTVVGGKAADVGLKSLGNTLSVLTAASDVLDTYFGEKIYKTYNEAINPNTKKTILSGSDSLKSSTAVSGPTVNGAFISSGGGNPLRQAAAPTYPQSQSQVGAGSYSSGGSGYTQLIASLSRLVAALSAYVSSLSTSKSR
jgi:hypothetical protein